MKAKCLYCHTMYEGETKPSVNGDIKEKKFDCPSCDITNIVGEVNGEGNITNGECGWYGCEGEGYRSEDEPTHGQN